jgi:hypothetical protein
MFISTVHSITTIRKLTHYFRMNVYTLIPIWTLWEKFTLFTGVVIQTLSRRLITIRKMTTTNQLLRLLNNYRLCWSNWLPFLLLLCYLLTTFNILDRLNRTEFFKTLLFQLLSLILCYSRLFKIKLLNWFELVKLALILVTSRIIFF